MNIKIVELHQTFCNEAVAIRNVTRHTIKGYKSSLKQLLKHTGAEFLSQLTHEKCREFLFNGRINRDWTPETFQFYYKAIKPFFLWCIKRSYMNANPLEGIDMPRREKKLPKRISKDDALKLLEYAFNMKYTYRYERYRNRAVIATFIYSGLRSQELLDLKMGDVDLLSNVIMVRSGKGGKDRVVPICIQLNIYLREYLKDRDRLKRECINFFTSSRGDIPFTYNGLKKMVEILRKKAGVQFSSHRLRHTFATLMLEGGCDLFSLQKMMGHSDIKTTTIYLSATVNHLQEQIRKHPLG